MPQSKKRPDVVVQRKDWRATQETVDAERLVFLDETGLKTDFTRLRGWAEGGNRLVEAVPSGKWANSHAGSCRRFGRHTCSDGF